MLTQNGPSHMDINNKVGYLSWAFYFILLTYRL